MHQSCQQRSVLGSRSHSLGDLLCDCFAHSVEEEARFVIILVTAVVSAALTWVFSEISHRHSSKRAVANQTAFLHKTEQLTILSELQDIILEYYRIYSKFLWGTWEESEGTLNKKDKAHVAELWDSMELTALKMFAVSSRGVMMNDGESTRSRDNVVEHDQGIQRTAILLNLEIGDQQLRLLGLQKPEDLH
jgi:hypothetical protein